MSIKPLADRVLVRPAAQEEKTTSGIIIPDSAKEKPLKGEIPLSALRDIPRGCPSLSPSPGSPRSERT